MRLFGYYITHTVINTIKKLFKTWIAFIFIVILFGAVVGGIAGVVGAALSKDAVEEVTQNEELQEVITDTVNNVDESLWTFNIDFENIVELAVSGLFLFLFFLCLFSAKGIGEIFLTADANLLFAAPLKPQTVMMFRLMMTLGMQIMISFFMLFQIPNLVVNMHMSVTAAVTIFAAWIIVNLVGTLFQVFLYILSSYSEVFKKNFKFVAGGLLAVILAVFIYKLRASDSIWEAAAKTITGKNTYWVPFWGWTRGMCMNAISGNNLYAYIFLALNVIGIVAFVLVIWNMKVDFYEDALISAERRQEQIEKAKAQKTGVVRNKDRSEKIKRDGFNKGSGANVFFFKTLYNRKRLSYFGLITKTMIVYAFAVAAAVIIMRNADNFADKGFLLACSFLTLVAFYRTMGNPLSEDLSRDFFAMIPSSNRSKLGYSILGGLVNTIFDLIVPYIFAAVWFKAGVGEAIVWFIFLLAIDLYGTVVSAFIMMSVSVSLPEMVQKMVQVLFIYFGILPAIMFIIVGVVFDNVVLFMPFGIVMNLILSFIFFMIIPCFMQNGRK